MSLCHFLHLDMLHHKKKKHCLYLYMPPAVKEKRTEPNKEDIQIFVAKQTPKRKIGA